MDNELTQTYESNQPALEQQTKNNSLAITSMVLAICSILLALLPLVGLIGFILAIVSILLAVASKKQIRKRSGAQKGSGMATAGLIIGIITTFLSAAAQALFFALMRFALDFSELNQFIQ